MIKRIVIALFKLNSLMTCNTFLTTSEKSLDAVGSPFPENAISLNTVPGGVFFFKKSFCIISSSQKRSSFSSNFISIVSGLPLVKFGISQ